VSARGWELVRLDLGSRLVLPDLLVSLPVRAPTPPRPFPSPVPTSLTQAWSSSLPGPVPWVLRSFAL
jgi:hypothetical protein